MSSTNDIQRVYPLRTSRKDWAIPLYCVHECNILCQKIYSQDRKDNSRYYLVDNPKYKNGKCPQQGKTEKTLISLTDFDMNNPKGFSGPLYNPNMIVIPDKSCSVFVDYPLSRKIEVKLKASENGFTLKYLLFSLCSLYKFIYLEEERTAVPEIYTIKKRCQNCIDKNVNEYIKYVKDFSDFECSICFEREIEDTNNKLSLSELQCTHTFHTHCILNWVETSYNDINPIKCPLCRQSLIKCDDCDSQGVIYHEYKGVVIPLCLRGNITNRNTTNGMFGIYGYDIEDLVIQNLYYDRINKNLYLTITS